MNIKQILFQRKFSFCILFFDVVGRCLEVFKKLLIFKVPVIKKNFAERADEIAVYLKLRS